MEGDAPDTRFGDGVTGPGRSAIFKVWPLDVVCRLVMARASDEADETAVWWVLPAGSAVGLCWFPGRVEIGVNAGPVVREDFA